MWLLLVFIMTTGQFNTGMHFPISEYTSLENCQAGALFYKESIDKEHTVKTLCVKK